MRPERAGFRFRLFWPLVVVAVVAVIATSGVFTYLAVRTVERDVSTLHLEIAQRARLAILNSFEDLLREVHRAAREIGARRRDPPSTIAELFRANPQFQRASFIDGEGKEFMRLDRFAVATAGELADYGESRGFRRAAEGREYLGQIFFSERGEPLISLFVPVLSLQGDFRGAVLTDINLRFLWDLMAGIGVGRRGRAYVVDERGNLIADPDASAVLRGENLLSRAIVERLLGGETAVSGLEAGERYKDFEGRETFAAGLRMEPFGWAVITEEPVRDALVASRRTLAVGVGLSLASVTLLLILLFAIRTLFTLTQFLERERAHTLAIISSLVDGIIEYSTEFEILLLNPAAERILGVRSDDLKGRRVGDTAILGNPALQSFTMLFTRKGGAGTLTPFLQKEERNVTEVTLPQPSEIALQVTTIPVVSPHGRVETNVKILHDISREKLLNRLKSEFISIAAHQLRTPLSAIKWTLKLLLDGDLGPITIQEQEYVQSAYQTNERMIKLVNDLLSVSRIEEGRLEYLIREDDLVELLTEAMNSFKEITENKRITLGLEKPKKPLPKIYFDRERIQIVLQNLIENAVHYTPAQGRVTITIREESKDLVVEVSDTGIGILEKDRAQLFTKFYRSAEAIKMNPNGSGLGLFIVRNIVLRHGGTIAVTSKVGKGSTFRFTLPKEKSSIPVSAPKDVEFGEFIREF